MPIIDRIKSIAKKLGVQVSGETISELLLSLEKGIDKKAKSDISRLERKPEKKFEFSKSNKFSKKEETTEE